MMNAIMQISVSFVNIGKICIQRQYIETTVKDYSYQCT